MYKSKSRSRSRKARSRKSRTRNSRSRSRTRSRKSHTNSMDDIFKRCKQWNNKENKLFHVVCKGGAHVAYKIPDVTTTDIDLVIYTRKFDDISEAKIQTFCNYLLIPNYSITTHNSLYTVVSAGMPIDISVINETYLKEESNSSSIVHTACTELHILMRDFFQVLYDQNKLFPSLQFEQKQSEAGVELYDFFITRVQTNMAKQRNNEVLNVNESNEIESLDKYYIKYLAYENKLTEISAKITEEYDNSDEAVLS